MVERRDVRVNKKIKNIYDGYGRVEKTETPLGAITYSYDAMDRIEKKSMPVPGAGGSVTPSGLNPPAPTVTSKTVAEETRYDAMGRVTYQGTALTNVSHKYDKLGRIRETTRRGIGVRGTLTEKHYYNEFGERVAAWIEPGYYHKFEHDFKANKTTETVYHNYRRRGRRVIEFDPLGKPRRVTEAQSQDMQCDLDYDAGGRLKSYVLKWAGREIAKVAYDYYRGVKPNEVTLSYDNRARRIFYTYNSNLMVSKISDSDLSYNGDYTFKYNKAGLKTEMGRWVDAKAKTTFKYHPNAVLAEMKHVLGEDWEKTFTTKIAANAYDWQGNPKTIKHTFLDEGDPDAEEDFLQEESHKYDDTNRVIESKW